MTDNPFTRIKSEHPPFPSEVSCLRLVSNASLPSISDTSWSERSVTDESSPTKSIESMSKLSTDDGKSGKKRLNWKEYLKDGKFTMDMLSFEKHRTDYDKEDFSLVKDLKRTRSEDPYFQKPSNICAMKDIAYFYCNSNNVHYQQGLLEIIAPFLKLRSTTFRTRHCYAYFASFMRNYFPNILTQITVNEATELPHLNTAINYCAILLDYHANRISNILKERDFDLRTFVTCWIMTLFAQGTKMELVYDIFDHYMAEKNKYFIFYLIIAVILSKEKEIIQIYENHDETRLITYLNRYLKDEAISTSEDVQNLFLLARKIRNTTPSSFETILTQMGLMDIGILSVQECKEYLSRQHDSLMEIYPFEVIDFLVSRTANEETGDYGDNKSGIEFKFLDCRKSRNSESLPFTLEIPDSACGSFERLKTYIKDCCITEKESHIILLKTNNCDKEEESFVQSIIHLLRAQNKQYVSICVGGYNAIIQEIERRKVKIPLVRKTRSLILQKLRGIFTKT